MRCIVVLLAALLVGAADVAAQDVGFETAVTPGGLSVTYPEAYSAAVIESSPETIILSPPPDDARFVALRVRSGAAAWAGEGVPSLTALLAEFYAWIDLVGDTDPAAATPIELEGASAILQPYTLDDLPGAYVLIAIVRDEGSAALLDLEGVSVTGDALLSLLEEAVLIADSVRTRVDVPDPLAGLPLLDLPLPPLSAGEQPPGGVVFVGDVWLAYDTPWALQTDASVEVIDTVTLAYNGAEALLIVSVQSIAESGTFADWREALLDTGVIPLPTAENPVSRLRRPDGRPIERYADADSALTAYLVDLGGDEVALGLLSLIAPERRRRAQIDASARALLLEMTRFTRP